jgi:hypothetical protein
VLVTSTRTAPFVSPIRVELANKDNPVGANLDYSKRIEGTGQDEWSVGTTFQSAADLLNALPRIVGSESVGA